MPAHAYERVRVTEHGGQEVASFATGDPVADWASCVAYLKKRGMPFSFTSSVGDFVFDVPGYKLIEERRVEWLVIDDHDEPKGSSDCNPAVEGAGSLTA